MKAFYNNSFQGHWLVGTSAVVVAENEVEAAEKLEFELVEQGLKQRVSPNDMAEIDLSKSAVYIL